MNHLLKLVCTAVVLSQGAVASQALEVSAEHTYTMQARQLGDSNEQKEVTVLLRVVLKNDSDKAVLIPTASEYWCVGSSYRIGRAEYSFRYAKTDSDEKGAPFIPPEAKYLTVLLQPGESTLVFFQDTVDAERISENVIVRYQVDEFIGKRFHYWMGAIECVSRAKNSSVVRKKE